MKIKLVDIFVVLYISRFMNWSYYSFKDFKKDLFSFTSHQNFKTKKLFHLLF